MNKETDLGKIFKIINEGLEKRFNSFLIQTDLTLAQVRVLYFLHSSKNKEATQKEIETDLSVSHPTINGILKRMELKKYIKTEMIVNKRLSKIVTITDLGIEKLKESKKSQKIMETSLTSFLTKDEKETLYKLLGQIIKGLNETNIDSF